MRHISADCEPLKADTERWAEAHLDELRNAEPELPAALSDREQDCIDSLAAIADLAGAGWPEKARAAFVALYGGREADEDSWGVQLLAAVRTAFDGDEQLPTTELIERLHADELAPWRTWGKGDAGLTPRGLAGLLRPYRVRSGDIHVEESGGRKTLKGYAAEDFADAWGRYLTRPDPPPKRAKRANGSTEPKTEGFYPRQDPELARIEDGRKPHGKADGADGADGETTGDPRRPRRPGSRSEAHRGEDGGGAVTHTRGRGHVGGPQW